MKTRKQFGMYQYIRVFPEFLITTDKLFWHNNKGSTKITFPLTVKVFSISLITLLHALLIEFMEGTITWQLQLEVNFSSHFSSQNLTVDTGLHCCTVYIQSFTFSVFPLASRGVTCKPDWLLRHRSSERERGGQEQQLCVPGPHIAHGSGPHWCRLSLLWRKGKAVHIRNIRTQQPRAATCGV